MKTRAGFTIVELLIVIVVIGILAAITLVAFGGVRDRATYATLQSDMKAMNQAIQLYYADKGHYPYSGTTGGNVTGATLTIPGLLPDYIDKMPRFPSGAEGYYAYIWSPNGANYKLARLIATTGQSLLSAESSNPNPDPARATPTNRGWGYWSPGGSSL